MQFIVQNDEITLPSPTLALLALVLLGTAVLWALIGAFALVGTAVWCMLGARVEYKASLVRTR
jgi:hypothetical protein